MCIYLKPFDRIFQKIEELQFDKISVYFAPLFHLLALSWTKSESFRISSRFIILIQKIVSALVIQTKKYLESTEILKAEPHESIEKVDFALKVLDSFIRQFKVTRAKLPEYFANENIPLVSWELNTRLLFSLLIGTNRRLLKIKVYINSRMEMYMCLFTKFCILTLGNFEVGHRL